MKVALVTGASRGLGAQMAAALGHAGWGVAVNYAHDKPRAEKVVAGIVAASGQAAAVRFDITNDDAVVSGLAEVRQRLGAIDLLVNNATGPQPTIPIMQ
jgi:3-oxoacyl-[acyl-carrier protein] reductase